MKIANAPCSWGILEFGLDGKTDDYQKVLDEISSTGYMGTELGDWGFMPTSPDKLSDELSGRGLSLVGAFVPVNFINPEDHEEGAELAVRTAQLLKNTDPENARIVLSDDNGKDKSRTQNAGRILPENRLTKEQWKIFATGVETIAARVREETGVECVFHHHCGGYVETPEEISTFLGLTSPMLVNLCFDTGHYAFGGGDPVEGLKKHFSRIGHVHFKDWDEDISQESRDKKWDYFESVENGIFCELGKGSVNFTSILKELKARKYSGWIVVEQDILPGMGSPKESARRNREFLRSIGV